MSNKRKILYIDDEELNIMLFEYNFSRNFDVISATCPLKGLNILDQSPGIEVVISDMKMPVMNGLQFIAKAKETYIDKKYFILTGFDITDEINKALETKLIHKYFRKPLNIKEIEDSINELYN